MVVFARLGVVHGLLGVDVVEGTNHDHGAWQLTGDDGTAATSCAKKESGTLMFR